MTRILIVHPRPTRGGFSAVLSQAKELLAHGDFEITIAVADGPRISEIPGGVNVVLLEHRLSSFSGIFELKRVLRTVRPDVLHLHGRKAGLIGRLSVRQRDRPSVLYTPHGTVWMGSSWSRSTANDTVERLLLRRTDYVLCVSRAEQSDWVRRDPSSRVKYFPNLIDLDTVDVAPAVDRHDDGSVDVLVPSGYSPQKRLSVVVEALALMAEPRPKVLIAGAADSRKEIDFVRELATSLRVTDSLTFGGNVAKIRELMAEARVVVLPSYSEGMPIVGQEAILAGAHVAWSAIPPHFELFADCGEGFWTAEELARLLTLPRVVGSVSARRTWLARHQSEAKAIRNKFWTELAINAHGASIDEPLQDG